MKTPIGKKLRTLNRALEELFTTKSVRAALPTSTQILCRQLRLSDDRSTFLTDRGLATLRNICDLFDQSEVFEGLADYSDIERACRNVVEDCLSQGVRPDNASELLDLLRLKIEPQICRHTFIVPLFGVQFEDINDMELGSFRIVRPTIDYLTKNQVVFSEEIVKQAMQAMEPYSCLWLVGSASGTANVAQEKFRSHTELIVGWLAILAATTHASGASGFRIGTVASSDLAYFRSNWMYWDDKARSVVITMRGDGTHDFRLTDEWIREMKSLHEFDRGLSILSSEDSSDLEGAIKRAVYWYSDAHRDKLPVMKLIKFWSCVETFFSTENEEIVRSVSTGLSSVLVFGPYAFVPEPEHHLLKKRSASLYKLRSKAVHSAAHDHVSPRDVADLSQWAAWLIWNMVALVERGYTTRKQVKEAAERLGASSSRPHRS